MKLLNKLTIKNLKLNKKRTIVTIIGIILSVALLTAVASMFFSARSSLIKFERREKGNYHYGFKNVPIENINEFKQNRKIEKIYLTQELGYDYLDGSKNEYKPYIYIKAFDKEAIENLAVNLIDGRLPENENEILVSNHTKTNGGVTFNIGEELSLNIGTRVSEGQKLKQSNPYNPEVDEKIIDTKEHTYTVVGIIERLPSSIEEYAAPGYTFITYMNELNQNNVDIYVRYNKKGLEEYKNLEDKMENVGYDIKKNTYLLVLETGVIGDSTLKALATAAIIVVIIIIFTSVFCIKNSFDISITEKTKQYGMLSSIGATKKQIKKNVYYEAFLLWLIGTPIGVLCGEFATFILINVSNYFLKDLLNVKLIFSFSWLAIIFSIILAFVTIYLSARKSAKRASKIAPITAIRNSSNIKIKSKKIKSPKTINKIFGIGGEISYKNLKRSKKKYRTTVISIIVCVSIFIALSSFMNLAFGVIKVEYQNKDYNMELLYTNKEAIDEKMKEIYMSENIKKYSIIGKLNAIVKTDKYSKEYLELHPKGGEYSYTDENGNKKIIDNITIYSVNTEEFSKYVKKLGLKYEDVKDKGILINNIYDIKTIDEKDISVEIPKYTFKVGDYIQIEYGDSVEEKIEIAKITMNTPMGVDEYNDRASLIVDEGFEKGNSIYYNIYIDSKNADKTQEDIEELLKDNQYAISNLDQQSKMMKSFYTLVAIFLYGFITVIALIGITNIFNTITTNMNLRRREFAMLKSIGMTEKEFDKMIRLESFFYGTKSLIVGIPIGCILSYAIYKVLMSGDLIMKYKLPLTSIIIAILAVFILITTIMNYSIREINKQNIIDTIRNDNI